MKNVKVRVLLVCALCLTTLVGCGPPVCAGIPECEAGETKSATVCTSSETGCRKVELCGTTIYCRKP